MFMSEFEIQNLTPTLKGKKILLGVTGSIAAYKACELVRTLRRCGAQVRVILTPGAENFVTQTTLETLSDHPVLTGFWNHNPGQPAGTHHIATARWADLLLIAPATANCIAKLAHGIADDLLTTEALAFKGPTLIAPAMNPAMFDHPSVRENIARLSHWGTKMIGPAQGETACGEDGLGRLEDISAIVQSVAQSFYPTKKAKTVLITLGPTQSKIDPVRYLTNRSSGLMGASLCWAAAERGYSVIAVCGPTTAPLPHCIRRIDVVTAEQMASAVESVWREVDIFIGSAAVLDWDIENFSDDKLKKSDGVIPQLSLKLNPDILAWAGKNKKETQLVVGFAAETQKPIEHALLKMKKKNCDAIFANDVSHSEIGFESEHNAGWWITPHYQPLLMNKSSKAQIARAILSQLSTLSHKTSSRKNGNQTLPIAEALTSSNTKEPATHLSSVTHSYPNAKGISS